TPASDDPHSIYVVSPYIPGLFPCSRRDYRRQSAPKLVSYLADRTDAILSGSRNDTFYMEDIFRIDQYSKLKSNGEPFLHDIETALNNSAEHAAKTQRTLAAALVDSDE